MGMSCPFNPHFDSIRVRGTRFAKRYFHRKLRCQTSVSLLTNFTPLTSLRFRVRNLPVALQNHEVTLWHDNFGLHVEHRAGLHPKALEN